MTTPTFFGYVSDRGFCQTPYWASDLKNVNMNSDLKLISSPSSSSACSVVSQSCPRQVTPCDYSKAVLRSPYLKFPREPDHTENGEKIKRPMNAFMVWSQERRAQIANSECKMHNSQISKELGAEWRKMSNEEKAPYIKKAKELRDELLRQHPDYVYRPKRKPRTAKTANHSVSPASTSSLKQAETPVDTRMTTAAQLLLASEAQKQQQQTFILAYQTQLLASLLKENQQKMHLISAAKQNPVIPATVNNGMDPGFLPYMTNHLQRQLMSPEPSLLSALTTLNPQLNPMLFAKLSQPQIPPISFANIISQ